MPARYEAVEWDVRQVIIARQSGGFGPFVPIATISATNDGEPKSRSNEWVSEYEDMTAGDADVYQVAFIDSNGKMGQYSQQGAGGYLSRFHQLMDLVRTDLGDLDPSFYQLDKVPQFRWTGTELARWMNASLNDFNGSGPMVTKFTFDTIPDDATPVVEEIVKWRAYTSRETKEVPNVLSYNDGVSFSITNRVADYGKLADTAYRIWRERAKDWKLAHRPSAIGLGAQKLPFRVLRPMSFLANMSNTFGM
jgi:hypothetical protein